MRTTVLVLACAASFAAAAPVVPGEFTDPTNIRRSLDEQPVSWAVVPDRLHYPYVAT